jgi:hypothetical protein
MEMLDETIIDGDSTLKNPAAAPATAMPTLEVPARDSRQTHSKISQDVMVAKGSPRHLQPPSRALVTVFDNAYAACAVAMIDSARSPGRLGGWSMIALVANDMKAGTRQMLAQMDVEVIVVDYPIVTPRGAGINAQFAKSHLLTHSRFRDFDLVLYADADVIWQSSVLEFVESLQPSSKHIWAFMRELRPKVNPVAKTYFSRLVNPSDVSAIHTLCPDIEFSGASGVMLFNTTSMPSLASTLGFVEAFRPFAEHSGSKLQDQDMFNCILAGNVDFFTSKLLAGLAKNNGGFCPPCIKKCHHKEPYPSESGMPLAFSQHFEHAVSEFGINAEQSSSLRNDATDAEFR